MDFWDTKIFVEGILSEKRLYESYLDFCMKVEVVPVTRERFVDVFVDIILNKENLYEKATSYLPNDKMKLIETLELSGATVEDLVTVDDIPPFVTVTLNETNTQMICIYVLFLNGTNSMLIAPSYTEKGMDEIIFL